MTAIWGVYDFASQTSTDVSNVLAFNAFTQKPVGVVNFFTDWCAAINPNNAWFTSQVFDQDKGYLYRIWNTAHAIPLITWQPACWDPNAKTTSSFIKDVSSGKYDSYLKSWGTSLKKFLDGADGKAGTADDRRAYIRLAHEMNLNQYPWSKPADYVNFWRHTHTIISTLGIRKDQLQWMWCPNNFGQQDATLFYPGSAFFDWFGFDAYNQPKSNYATPDSITSSILNTFASITPKPNPAKPVAVAEFGCNADRGAAARADWIKTFLATLVDSGKVQMVAHFNAGDYNVSKDARDGVVKAVASSKSLQGRDSANQRIVSDSLFLGTAVTTKKAVAGGLNSDDDNADGMRLSDDALASTASSSGSATATGTAEASQNEETVSSASAHIRFLAVGLAVFALLLLSAVFTLLCTKKWRRGGAGLSAAVSLHSKESRYVTLEGHS
ncbi:glycoside hydrolase superfamily [Zopfochytrium polystomum]|nr:glycoside hydrolase superfamily [Zopfochytrium polystomum]